MGTPQSHPQTNQNRRPADRDAAQRERSVSLVTRLKERSASIEATRGDYVVGTGHYVLTPNARIEAYDTWKSNRTNSMVFRWRPARVRKVREDSVLVAFDGFSERWDTWLPLSEGKVRSPTGGPVMSPDGILYPPKNTPEPARVDDDMNIVPAAAPFRTRYPPDRPSPRFLPQITFNQPLGTDNTFSLSSSQANPQQSSPSKDSNNTSTATMNGVFKSNHQSATGTHTRGSSLGYRIGLSLFKKASRSEEDENGGGEEFNDAIASVGDEKETVREEGDKSLQFGADSHSSNNRQHTTTDDDDDKEIEMETKEGEKDRIVRIQRTISSTSSMVVETGDIAPPVRAATPPHLSIPYIPFFRRSGGDLTAKSKSHSDLAAASTGNNPNETSEGNSSTGDGGISPTALASQQFQQPQQEDKSSAPPAPSQTDSSATTTTTSTAPPPSFPSNASIATQNRGISGLYNLGNTCFMNAILQSLSHVAPLVERMINEVSPLPPTDTKQVADIQVRNVSRAPGLVRSDRIARVFCTLVRDQWKANPEKARRPEELRQIISEISTQFQGHWQQDAQELLIVLLDALHDSLNRIKRRPTYVEINPPKNLSDAELAFLYWDNYERGNDSFIKDLFCGQLMSKVSCGDCGEVSTSFDVFWDLSLPVPVQEKTVHLDDILRSFCDVEKMPTDCGFKCESCKKVPVHGATKQFTIAKYPRVLVLHLKRFWHERAGTKKIVTPVTFPVKGLQAGHESYDLAAVVNHVGMFGSGHYTADVYNPLTKTWFHADDTNFTPTTRIGVNGYLLFYVEARKAERSMKTLCYA